jgi:SAM-dependent methyltransferase
MMAHKSQINFFEIAISHFHEKFSGKIIDIGSLDINGGPHKLFRAHTYVGVDLAAGLNVTHLARGEEVDFPKKSFDVAMSSECFEHNPNYAETIVNMSRMTKDDGVLIFSAAGIGRREHGTPRSDQQFSAPLLTNDRYYYRNLSSRRISLVVNDDEFPKYFIFRNWLIRDIYFIGIKNPSRDSLNRLDICSKEIK